LLRGLYNNIRAFVRDAPIVYLNGYTRQNFFSPDMAQLIFRLGVGLVCLFLIVAATWPERLFWAGLGLGTIASVAIIFADDGWRILQVSHHTAPTWHQGYLNFLDRLDRSSTFAFVSGASWSASRTPPYTNPHIE
jgi:hypothetical protein